MAGKIVAFNGGPRKKWNTATLLEKALEGATAAGMETELVHLYDLDFKGCASCFACKRKGGVTGRCAMRDGLSPFLDKVSDCDALLIGSPIYLGAATGETRSFLERLVFPNITYTATLASVFPRRIPVGLIYTMNVPETMVADGPAAFNQGLGLTEMFLTRAFGPVRTLMCYDTWQFDDYSKMDASRFDAEAKARRRREVFPVDCEKAYEMGGEMAKGG